MARGHSGGILLPSGTFYSGPVTLPDGRVKNLRELLPDLARPGVCLVLGAGASHGVVPLSRKEMAAAAWEIVQTQGNFRLLPSHQRSQLETYPELLTLVEILKEFPPDSWERVLDDVPDMLRLSRPIGIRSNALSTFVVTAPDAMSHAQGTIIWDAMFTPKTKVPAALTEIYSVLENRLGTIVCYNYDRIVERQTRFPVITPHGQRPSGRANLDETFRRMAWELHLSIPTDWHLPIPEDDRVRARYDYQRAIEAWRSARSVVLVGYAFGGGADAFSFEDFSRHLASDARVHVLCPRPDNADLCKQVAWALRGRPKRFRVFGQPFRWRSFAEATLALVRRVNGHHVASILGMEPELIDCHDRY